ncbi:MAG TPA: biotin--[acetyl-CoA-carboxylase] ligase [Nitrospira sp.]|nr:biotin--[acetyl-CoA-carboxylase] ligase [Nitrospira sp.]
MQSSPPLSLQAIQHCLATQALGRRIELRDQIGSTNREAVLLAQAGVEHGTVVLADSQSEGRGRLSRLWFSPPGVNLYCSIVIRTAISADRHSEWLSWLPLTTALAAAEAIETVAATRVAVKWPNDLLIAGRKIGGILCESGTNPRSGPFQVIGIGLNINGERNDFPDELRETATTIRHEAGSFIDRNRLLAQLLYELEACLDEYAQRGFERLALAYGRRCSTIGKTVKATLADGKELVGLAEAIGKDGSLTLVQRAVSGDERAPKVQQLRAADIVHLRS